MTQRDEDSKEVRKVRVPILTRVEGEGALNIELQGNELRDVQLRIFEPPRLFEAFLQGRKMEEVPDFTARICGICPIAYQVTAVQALEQALGVTLPYELESLRRLIYYGEWIESHVLHMHLLHAPDFFGCASGIELAQKYPEEVKRGLRMKKHGNRLLEVLGGRAIHPINVAVGGFYRLPSKEDLQSLIPDFEWALEAAKATAEWILSLEYPDFDVPYQFVALSHPDEYAIHQGDVRISDGTWLESHQYEHHFEEIQVPHSNAYHSLRKWGGSTYFVGPLARVLLNGRMLSPSARTLLEIFPMRGPRYNPQWSIYARALEVVHAFESSLQILKAYVPYKVSRLEYRVRESEGTSCTEAPRGLIYHRYRIDDDGRIQFAKIVPPTSQNQAQIESDLRALIPKLLKANGTDKTSPDSQHWLTGPCEHLIRSYDPCISCSTHFLRIHVRQFGHG